MKTLTRVRKSSKSLQPIGVIQQKESTESL